jgi:hypothetical protein
MNALFQKFLEDAEAAGLSEGEYLKVTSALQRAYDNRDAPSEESTNELALRVISLFQTTFSQAETIRSLQAENEALKLRIQLLTLHAGLN